MAGALFRRAISNSTKDAHSDTCYRERKRANNAHTVLACSLDSRVPDFHMEEAGHGPSVSQVPSPQTKHDQLIIGQVNCPAASSSSSSAIIETFLGLGPFLLDHNGRWHMEHGTWE